MIEQPWAVSPQEAADLLNISRRTLYRQVMPHVYSGVIKSARIGRLCLIDVQSLRAWWEQQLVYNSQV
jgi:excisionase family DNA binding protein